MKIWISGHAVLRYMAISALLLCACSSVAAPVNVIVEHKTVGDTVQYTPNLSSGGFASPSERARFTENSVRLQWQKDNQLSITAGFSDRQFTTLRDHFSFLQTTLTAQITPWQLADKQTSLWLSISSNRADELNKNSYTTIDNLVLTSARVQKPEDLKVEFGLKRGVQLNLSTRVLGLFSAGATDSRHSGIAGNFSRGACDYQFKFHDNGGVVNQVNQCGNVSALNRIYPNDESVEADFGVSPVKDFRNKSVYARVGIGFRKDYRKWTFTSRYYYQKYFRDTSGSSDTTLVGNSYNENQVFSVETSHRLTNNITVAGHIEYQRHRYLDEVPVLYTKLTADRFKGDALFFTARLKYHLPQ